MYLPLLTYSDEWIVTSSQCVARGEHTKQERKRKNRTAMNSSFILGILECV